MNNNYDVIVIGAGNGGLIAAATSAQRGLKTLLLEKHNLPGGCATSFKRGRFEFETALHELDGYGTEEEPGEVRRLFESLGVDVDFIAEDEAYRTIITGEDGFDADMPAGKEEFIKKMIHYEPDSEKSIREFFSLTDDFKDTMKYIAQSHGKPDPEIMQKEHINFLKLATKPFGEVLDILKMPKRAKDILSTYWSYLGAPGSELDFMYFSLLVESYVNHKAYIPKNRSHEISLAIEKRIRELGGDVWYNTEVKKILVKEGQAYGVATKAGEFYAGQIISNVIPHVVFGSMVDKTDIPEFELKKANARSLGAKGYVMYIGLNKSPEELGIENYTVFLSSTADADEQFRRMHSTEDNDYLIMNCLNIANPGCSPEGTSILYATKLYFGNTWEEMSPKEYYDLKNEVARKIIEQYEKATGIIISDAIEEISIAAPQTFARYLGTPNGTIYGYYASKWDGMVNRTFSMNNEMIIKGLKFCGGHSVRLNGYSSAYATGKIASSLAIAELRGGR